MTMEVKMCEFDNMVAWLDAAWPARSCIVPCLLGSPGIGKTAAVEQHAKNVGAGKVVVIIASQILPNEVSGITMPVQERHAMEIFDHYRLSSLQDGDILFFDELLEADQLVLSACLTLIESRQLMSGHKLPDIQIIAATNATIKPSQLKENIRQRFVWRDFRVDPCGCQDYIKKTYGIDIGNEIRKLIVEHGQDYNVFTMRSCTKMVQWICSAKDKAEARQIADAIDAAWDNQVGSCLYRAWLEANTDQVADLYVAIEKACDEAGLGEVYKSHKDLLSIDELVDLLQEQPGWDKAAEMLAAMTTEEEEVRF